MIYLVGGNGFVGSAYVRLLAARGIEHTVITRENYDTHRGTSCEILINANGNSMKFLADRDPLGEFDMSVRSVAETLQAFDAATYVLLSTGDVYPDQSAPDVSAEDQPIEPARLSRYGLHIVLAEQIVTGTHPDWLVIRMGGFVGPGLKKNAVYDMLTGAPIRLSPDSELQFIATDNGAALVWQLIETGVRREIVNLGARGLVRLGDLHRRIGSASLFEDGAPPIRYEISLEKLAGLVDGPLPETSDDIEGFIGAWQAEHAA